MQTLKVLKNAEGLAEKEYWESRAKTAEQFCRTLIKVNPMVKNLKAVKEARDNWAKYCNLHDQLKVWNDHE